MLLSTQIAICLVIFFATSRVAGALELGIYGGTGSGTSQFRSTYSDGTASTLDKKTEHREYGVVLDGILEKGLFEYNLNVGFESVTAKPGNGTHTYDLDGFVITNHFIFKVIRSEAFSFWLGPELRFDRLTGKEKSEKAKYRNVELYGVGFGPILGIDFKVRPMLTLGIRAGHVFNYYTGQGEKTQPSYSNADYHIKENHSFLHAAITHSL